MPMDARIVGTKTEPIAHVADARWIMSYAAGINETTTTYFDSTKPLWVHPVFCVCPEWPALLNLRHPKHQVTLTPDEAKRGVHATHYVELHKTLPIDNAIYTTAEIIGVEQRSPGAYQLCQLDTRNSAADLCVRTIQGGLSRDVEVVGTTVVPQSIPSVPAPNQQDEVVAGAEYVVPIAVNAAHVYTECARIFNPIHTDRRYALAAGLPDIVLHGTATLAYSLSALLNQHLHRPPNEVRRYACRFSAMVLMPNELHINVHAQTNDQVWFTTYNNRGEAAITKGYLELAQSK